VTEAGPVGPAGKPVGMRGDDIDLDHAARRRFPALDAELSAGKMARLRLRNAALVAAVAVVLAGAGGLTAYLAGGTTAAPGSARRAAPAVQTRPATSAPAGRVLSQTPRGALAVSGLRGHAPTVLMSLPAQVYVSSTLDSRYFVTTNGQLLSLGASGKLTVTRLRNVSETSWSAGGPEPLADHDKYLALQNFNTAGSQADGSPIMIRSLATQREQRLGTGDQLSGDPAAPGVIISLPAPIVATSTPTAAGASGMWPDSRVVMRDAGRKDVLLGTAAEFNTEVGLPAKTQDYLFPVPDPSGDKIAILVEPQSGFGEAQASTLPSGVVVVSRSGHTLYALVRAGRHVGAAWSPSGRELAMPAQGAHGSVLHLWTAAGHTSAQPFPGRADYAGCSWSPDDRWILCAVSGPHSSGEQWAVAAAAGGPMVATKGPGYPIAWLPGGSG